MAEIGGKGTHTAGRRRLQKNTDKMLNGNEDWWDRRAKKAAASEWINARSTEERYDWVTIECKKKNTCHAHIQCYLIWME